MPYAVQRENLLLKGLAPTLHQSAGYPLATKRRKSVKTVENDDSSVAFSVRYDIGLLVAKLTLYIIPLNQPTYSHSALIVLEPLNAYLSCRDSCFNFQHYLG